MSRWFFPIAYLFKVANGKAFDRFHENNYIIENELDDYSESDLNVLQDRPGLIEEAIKVAKELLPQIGQENVQLVMQYIFDCIEKGGGGNIKCGNW